MKREAILRALLGISLAWMSQGALHSSNPHLMILGAFEIAFGLLYAWPRAARFAGAGLLGVMAIAILFHAAQGELAGLPFIAALALLALWPEREIQAAAPADRAALQTFLLRAKGELSHESHLRVARQYLTQLPLGAAIEQFTADLKRYARRAGKPDKFHQTTTVAFLLLIRAALATSPEGETFEELLSRQPNLRSTKLLSSYYSDSLLASPLARSDLVLPDRQPLQAAENPEQRTG